MNTCAEPDPEQLLNLARLGDRDALGRLFELYRNYLGMLIRLQIGRRLQAKVDESDIIQDTLSEASRHFHEFRGTSEGELVNWLRQILATTVANLYRRYFHSKCRDVRLERGLKADLDQSSMAMSFRLVSKESSPSHQAKRREQSVLLADALERLPGDYREVIVLSHMEGLSFPEVARRMDRSVDSVKNLWARALARLRRELGDMS